jgi:hypothetical protein
MKGPAMLVSTARISFALAVFGAVVSFMAWGAAAQAAELIVFERAKCVRCLVWEREIAPIYPKTDEGKRAPLRRVDLGAARPADLTDISDVKYTPTFVLVEDGREVGRIVGYNGDEFFWAQVDELLAHAP